MNALTTLLKSVTPDDFNKITLSIVAIVALFLGPLMQWFIAKRQIRTQEAIAKKQVEMQEAIAKKQVEMQKTIAENQVVMQEAISKKQVEMQEAIAKRQVDTQRDIAARQAADNISAKRQVWIDELRNDAAKYLTLMAQISLVSVEMAEAPPDESIQDLIDKVQKLRAEEEEVVSRIALRLNAEKPKHSALLDLLQELNSIAMSITADTTNTELEAARRSLGETRSSIISTLREILGGEWQRIKKGSI